MSATNVPNHLPENKEAKPELPPAFREFLKSYRDGVFDTFQTTIHKFHALASWRQVVQSESSLNIESLQRNLDSMILRLGAFKLPKGNNLTHALALFLITDSSLSPHDYDDSGLHDVILQGVEEGSERDVYFKKILSILRSGYQQLFREALEEPAEEIVITTTDDVREDTLEALGAEQMQVVTEVGDMFEGTDLSPVPGVLDEVFGERWPTEIKQDMKDKGILETLVALGQWGDWEEFAPIDGPRVWIPRKRFNMGSGKNARPAMIVMVDCFRGKIKPRVVYGSTTHLAASVLPRVHVNNKGLIFWFDKGHAEESIRLTPSYQRRILSKLYAEGEFPTMNLNDSADPGNNMLEVIARCYRFPGKGDELPKTFINNVAPNAFHQAKGRRDPFDNLEGFHLKDANPKGEEYLSLRSVKFERDVLNIHHPKYGPVNVFFINSQHPEHGAEYMVCQAQIPKPESFTKEWGVWISMLSANKAFKRNATTYMVGEKYFEEVGPAVLPLLEKGISVARMFPPRGKFAKKYDVFNGINEQGDVLMWKVLQKIPVIQVMQEEVRKICEEHPELYRHIGL